MRAPLGAAEMLQLLGRLRELQDIDLGWDAARRVSADPDAILKDARRLTRPDAALREGPAGHPHRATEHATSSVPWHECMDLLSSALPLLRGSTDEGAERVARFAVEQVSQVLAEVAPPQIGRAMREGLHGSDVADADRGRMMGSDSSSAVAALDQAAATLERLLNTDLAWVGALAMMHADGLRGVAVSGRTLQGIPVGAVDEVIAKADRLRFSGALVPLTALPVIVELAQVGESDRARALTGALRGALLRPATALPRPISKVETDTADLLTNLAIDLMAAPRGSVESPPRARVVVKAVNKADMDAHVRLLRGMAAATHSPEFVVNSCLRLIPGDSPRDPRPALTAAAELYGVIGSLPEARRSFAREAGRQVIATMPAAGLPEAKEALLAHLSGDRPDFSAGLAGYLSKCVPATRVRTTPARPAHRTPATRDARAQVAAGRG